MERPHCPVCEAVMLWVDDFQWWCPSQGCHFPFGPRPEALRAAA